MGGRVLTGRADGPALRGPVTVALGGGGGAPC